MSETVWICGKHISHDDNGTVWDFQGVFSTEEQAISACKDDNYFIGPTEMNVVLPEEKIIWPGCYYPSLVDK